MRRSKHERAIRAELLQISRDIAGLEGEASKLTEDLRTINQAIAAKSVTHDLLHRILDAGRGDDKGGEGDD